MISQSVEQVAAFCVGFAALVTALTVLHKSAYVGRPLRWAFRRLVTEPLTQWHEVSTERVARRVMEQALADWAADLTELRTRMEQVCSVAERIDNQGE